MAAKPYVLEACVESLPEAKKAEALGADRLELCGRLDLDGLTPSLDLIEDVLAEVTIPVKVMIRPRAGDFVYTGNEIKSMAGSMRRISKLGIQEFVLGPLTTGNKLDLDQISYLSGIVPGSSITIHKAIDLTPDPTGEVRSLTHIDNVRYVLSSGGRETALDGQATLREMIEAGRNKITIISAGRITRDNLQDVHAAIGGEEYHGKMIVGSLK